MLHLQMINEGGMLTVEYEAIRRSTHDACARCLAREVGVGHCSGGFYLAIPLGGLVRALRQKEYRIRVLIPVQC